jgi:chromosome segregation ATPase
MSEDTTKKFDDQSNGRFDQLFEMVQAMRSELADLKQTVGARLHDTRPIWEKVQADIIGLQEGQQGLTEGLANLSASQNRFEDRLEALRDEMRTGFRDLQRQFNVLYEAYFEVRGDYKDLDKRVYKLETERT